MSDFAELVAGLEEGPCPDVLEAEPRTLGRELRCSLQRGHTGAHVAELPPDLVLKGRRLTSASWFTERAGMAPDVRFTAVPARR